MGPFAAEAAFDAFGKLAGAIVCAAIALGIWDLASRSPMQVLRDVANSMRTWRSLIFGALRLATGGFFAVLSFALVLASLPAAALGQFSVLVIITFLTAMLVDALLGDAVRQLFHFTKDSRRPRGTSRDNESGE